MREPRVAAPLSRATVPQTQPSVGQRNSAAWVEPVRAERLGQCSLGTRTRGRASVDIRPAEQDRASRANDSQHPGRCRPRRRRRLHREGGGPLRGRQSTAQQTRSPCEVRAYSSPPPPLSPCRGLRAGHPLRMMPEGRQFPWRTSLEDSGERRLGPCKLPRRFERGARQNSAGPQDWK